MGQQTISAASNNVGPIATGVANLIFQVKALYQAAPSRQHIFLVKPISCPSLISLNAFTHGIHPPYVMLGISITVFGGPTKPKCGLREVFFDAFTIIIRAGKITFGLSGVLSRSFAIPEQRFW